MPYFVDETIRSCCLHTYSSDLQISEANNCLTLFALKKMSRLLYFGCIFLLLTSCNKEAQYIETIRSGENPYLLQVDTITGDFVLFRDDSILTSTDSYGLIGFYKDSAIGSTAASHYVQYNTPEQLVETDRTARFDSLVLLLYSDSLYYGDTSSQLQLSVHRLSENIRSENSQFYNSSSFPYESSPFGAYKGIFRPNSGDSIRIKLQPEFGQELFTMIQNRNELILTQAKFENWFKGIYIQADSTGSNVIFKIKKNMVLRLYYSEDEAVRKEKFIDFLPSAAPYQFNHFKQNFSGSPFAELASNKEVAIPSATTSILLQSFSNIRSYVRFSGLNEIKKTAGYVKVLNAQLEIKPVTGSFVPSELPSQLHLYIRDVNNSISGPLSYSDNSIQTGDLSIDSDFGKDTRYLYDVTSYVNYELDATTLTSQRLVLQIGGNENLMKRILIQNTGGNGSSRSRLILSMLVYQSTN